MTAAEKAAINNLIHWIAQWRKDHPGEATPPVIVAAEHAAQVFGGPVPPWREV